MPRIDDAHTDDAAPHLPEVTGVPSVLLLTMLTGEPTP